VSSGTTIVWGKIVDQPDAGDVDVGKNPATSIIAVAHVKRRHFLG
jgi:hypothetical protein